MADDNNNGFLKGMLVGAIGTHLLENTPTGQSIRDSLAAFNRLMFMIFVLSLVLGLIFYFLYFLCLGIFHFVF